MKHAFARIFGALLAGLALVPFTVAAADGTVSALVVKYRDGVVHDAGLMLGGAVSQQIAAALPTSYSVGPSTRDGATRVILTSPISIDVARAALNRLRMDPDVLYASVARDTPNTAPNGRPVSRLIVKYRDEPTSRLERENAPMPQARLNRIEGLAGMAVAHERGTSRGEHVVRFIAPVTPGRAAQIAQLVEQDADVAYADPDYWVTAQFIPNDPIFLDTGNGQWDLKAAGNEIGGANLVGAWDYTTGSPNILVSVIDTGALFNHAEMAGVFVGGYDMISTNSVANDGSGRDSNAADPGDWVAANECGAGGLASPSSWHGTHVAGTIAALANNGVGITGINWQTKIVPLRVLGKCGGYTSDINDAIDWASGGTVIGVPNNPNPARVLNLSLGGGGTCASSTQSVFNSAFSRGAVVAVAAGNSNDDASLYQPSGCSGVITVAATQRQGYKAHYSNYGGGVEISAPGGGRGYPNNADRQFIWSAVDGGAQGPAGDAIAGYYGTSQATPHIAGIASLMLSVNPSLTPGQVLSLMQTTARAFPAGGPTCDTSSNPRPAVSAWFSCQCTTAICGAGIVNATAAVIAALPTTSGNITISTNNYGAVSVSGATLVGSTIQNLQPNVVIQLGPIPGAGTPVTLSVAGLKLGPSGTLTIRSGAAGQAVLLSDTALTMSSIAGQIIMQSGNGANPPALVLRNPNGITIYPGATITAASGLTLNTINTLAPGGTSGQPIVNRGSVDGGPSLQIFAARVTGGGAFKGNAILLSSFGNLNNPINGAHYLSNGLQLSPSSGPDVALTINDYGTVPQFMNLKVNGNAYVLMPSAWAPGSTLLPNSQPMPPGAVRAAGVADPTYGGGSIILQATGKIDLQGGTSNDFVFTGGIAMKAGTYIYLNGVTLNQGWNTAGKPFQGIYLEALSITSLGRVTLLGNDLNWINFSTFPSAQFDISRLVRNPDGTASYAPADAVTAHLNTYSTLIEASANGQCWTCLVNTAPIDVD